MPTVRTSLRVANLNNGGLERYEDDLERDENDEEEETGSGSCDGDMIDVLDDEEEGGSSELDSEECDRRKTEFMDDITELSQQFCKVKDQLFNEREAMIERKLKDIEVGTDPDYIFRLDRLDQMRQHRHETAEILVEMKRSAFQEIFKSEELANLQNMNSDRDLLYDQLKHELEEKIKRLEEDRHSIDITSDLYESQVKKRKRNHPYNSSRRKKPAQVTGPYIIYNLPEPDIIEDWTVIKRATKQQVQRRKVEL